jgi:hypothetical protein
VLLHFLAHLFERGQPHGKTSRRSERRGCQQKCCTGSSVALVHLNRLNGFDGLSAELIQNNSAGFINRATRLDQLTAKVAQVVLVAQCS